VQHPSEIVKKGETVEVMILNIDPENKRISLGLKQLQDDPWLTIAETHPVGMEMEGQIARYQDNGLVVDLGNDLEGFVPQSQLPLPEGKSAEAVTKVGQGVALKVLEVDPIHHRIILAATDFLEMPEEPEAEASPAEAKPESEEPAPEETAAEDVKAEAVPESAAEATSAEEPEESESRPEAPPAAESQDEPSKA
jgi:small subunit ribosomal protein S1